MESGEFLCFVFLKNLYLVIKVFFLIKVNNYINGRKIIFLVDLDLFNNFDFYIFVGIIY